MMKKILQFLFFLGLGVFIMALVYRSQDAAFHEQCRLDGVPEDQCNLIDKLLTDFSTVNLGWMLLVVAAFTVSNIFRALRWQMLMAPMGFHARFSNSFLTILLGYFANLGFPRMGEVVRAGTLARYEKYPLQKVIGTLVVDRLMDFVCLALVIGLAFLFEGQTLLDFINKQRGTAQGAEGGLLHNPYVLGALAVMVLGAVALYLLRKRLMQLAIVQKVMQMLYGFAEGLRSVFRLESPALFIGYSLGIWLMFYLQCWFNLKAFPPTSHLDPGAALMVFVCGTLGFVIPTPGGMGSFHALAIAGLALYSIERNDAFSYAMIAFFAIQILYNIVGGLLALLILPRINRAS